MAISKDKIVNKGMLDEAVEAILKGMDNLFGKTEKRFNKVDSRLDKIEADVTFIKRDVQDIKADRFDTPTRTEFNKLKSEVETLQA